MIASLVFDSGMGSRLTTETRVLASDPGVLRRFTAYWTLIHPGSDLLRRSWLAAIRRRAESSGAAFRAGSP